MVGYYFAMITTCCVCSALQGKGEKNGAHPAGERLSSRSDSGLLSMRKNSKYSIYALRARRWVIQSIWVRKARETGVASDFGGRCSPHLPRLFPFVFVGSHERQDQHGWIEREAIGERIAVLPHLTALPFPPESRLTSG